MKTLWNKQTGEARQYETVDAREILENSPDLYADVDPATAPAPAVGAAENDEGPKADTNKKPRKG